MLDEYTAKNNRALQELVRDHGVKVQQLPMDVMTALKQASDEVIAELVAGNAQAKKVFDSVKAFRDDSMAYARVSELAYMNMREEIMGYQQALHAVRTDMADLMEIVEGEGGLKDLASQVRVVRHDLEDTRQRTSDLESAAQEQSARTMKLEQDMVTLRSMVESNMTETAGVAGALLSLREEVNGLRTKIGRYIIDQIKLVRQK